MTGLQYIERGFLVSVRKDAAGFHVSYVPRGLQQWRGTGGKPKVVPEYTALVCLHLEGVPVRWDNLPPNDHASQEDFERDARTRAGLLGKWLDALTWLIDVVRKWAGEFGWSMKEIEKPMEDSDIGTYKAPALLLQEETTKMLLEPVARAAPGVEGVVDLYLMPAYEDIASLYYHGSNKWMIRYSAADSPLAENGREIESKPLAKVSLRKVLEVLKSHAG